MTDRSRDSRGWKNNGKVIEIREKRGNRKIQRGLRGRKYLQPALYFDY